MYVYIYIDKHIDSYYGSFPHSLRLAPVNHDLGSVDVLDPTGTALRIDPSKVAAGASRPFPPLIFLTFWWG